MKRARLLMIVAVGLGFAGLPSLVANAADQTGAASSEMASSADLIRQVRDAKTPSDAVAAYADAVARGGDGVNLQQAFVDRMIALDVPEMAEAQAKQLTQRTPEGVNWAVLAYGSAKRGELDQALTQIQQAIKESSNDEFVQRTAGQLIAWYDVRAGQSQLADSTVTLADSVRKSVSGRRAANQGYDQAMAALTPQPAPVESGLKIHVGDAELAQLANNVNDANGPAPAPMALFYEAPYLMFPSYGYGYEPWSPAGYAYSSGSYLPGVTYYYDWWNRGVGPMFPFPGVDRDTRYLRLGNGFALQNGGGTAIYQPLFNNGLFGNGFGAPSTYYINNSGRRFSGYFPPDHRGRAFNNDGGIRTFGGQIGNSRLSQRMSGPGGYTGPSIGTPFIVNSPLNTGPVLGGAPRGFNGDGGGRFGGRGR